MSTLAKTVVLGALGAAAYALGKGKLAKKANAKAKAKVTKAPKRAKRKRTSRKAG